MSNLWIREALAKAGRQQKDLAKAWGVSEASVSRWLEGTQNQDLPASRIWILGQMIGESCDTLIRQLGLAGDTARLPPPSTRPAGDVPLGTSEFRVRDGEARILLHLDLPAAVAAELIQIVAKATKAPAVGP